MATQPQSVIPMAVRPMVRSDLPQEIQDILKKPLSPEAIGANPKIPGLSSIKPAFVIERLNEAFGAGGWDDSATIIDRTTRKEIRNSGQPNEKEVTLHVATVQLFFMVEKYGLHKENFGGSDNVDLGDALKGARTDALTKIASELGVGLEVYKSGREASADSLPLCPTCGKKLRKDKEGNGYYCWKAKEGCGATFSEEGLKASIAAKNKPPQSAQQQPRQKQRQQPVADNVEKITISAIVSEKRVEDRKAQNLDSILWLQVGNYRCASKDPKIWSALNNVKVNSKVTLLVSRLDGKDGAIYLIHKVIPNVPDMGGRQ